MVKCLITLDLYAIDMKSVMGREGVARLGLDKTKLDVKAAPSTLAFHAVWPVLTFAFGLVNQWDEDASMTMVRLGSRVTEAMMAGHAFAEALAPRVCGGACPDRLSFSAVYADGRRPSQGGRDVSELDRRV